MIFKASKKRIVLLAAIIIFMACPIMLAIPLENDVDRPGSDYDVRAIGSDPSVCESSCASDPKCKAFSYRPPGMDDNNAVCRLKNEIPEPVAADGVVSGVKEESVATTTNPTDSSATSTKSIEYHIEKYKVWHNPNGEGFPALIECFSSIGGELKTAGIIHFTETDDFTYSDGKGSGVTNDVIFLSYPYSRYNDILDLFRNGGNIYLTYYFSPTNAGMIESRDEVPNAA